MFLALSFLAHGGSLAGRLMLTLGYGVLFVPFLYLMDRMQYKQYLKRSASAGSAPAPGARRRAAKPAAERQAEPPRPRRSSRPSRVAAAVVARAGPRREEQEQPRAVRGSPPRAARPART